MTSIGASRNILVICENPYAFKEVISLAGNFGICAYPLPEIVKKCCLTNMMILKGPDQFMDGGRVMQLRDAIDEVFGFNSVILHAFDDGRNAVSCFEIFTDKSCFEQIHPPS